MKKIIGITIVLFTLLISASCNGLVHRNRLEKVILEENVQSALVGEEQVKIKSQQLDLKLPEGEYFSPAFYLNEEIYGTVDMGINTIQTVEQFPVGGVLKEKLYKLGSSNNLMETSKKVFSHVYYPKMIAYEENSRSDIETGKLLTIDYSRNDEPKEMKALDSYLRSQDALGNNTFIYEKAVNESESYLIIRTIIPGKGWTLYFYDQQKNKLYKRTGNVLNQEGVIYIDALKSFLWIDQDMKCYKVVFNGDEYDYVEYMDLKPFLNNSSEKNPNERKGFIEISSEEILIETKVLLRNDGYFNFHPIYETKSLSIFNFKTNQFQELFSAGEEQHMNISYAVNSESLGGKLLIIDEFQYDNGYISPKERYLKTIVDGELSTLFREDISGEGKTLSPIVRAVVSDNGKEMFLVKDITDIVDNIEKTRNVIYKKYTFE